MHARPLPAALFHTFIWQTEMRFIAMLIYLIGIKEKGYYISYATNRAAALSAWRDCAKYCDRFHHRHIKRLTIPDIYK